MSDDNGTSATDIITYIGVPLAVLGVLPILYNTFATLVSLSRIKRMLRHSRLTALTRSDVVNRVIEIELPRYAVTPWDRHTHRDEYWSLSRNPSMIPGGTWTTFNWRTNAIGIKTQRVEYADQVRQPQVEVNFAELVAYLLDLGAVPDPHGWKLLRSTGLWTPVGCSLMLAPDGEEKALTVAPLDDSDGNLSLAAAWSSAWTTRDHSHLPPYWVRLPPPKGVANRDGGAVGEALVSTQDPTQQDVKKEDKRDLDTNRHSVDTLELEGMANKGRAITCEVSIEGVTAALARQERPGPPAEEQSLYIEHLRSSQSETNGTWFASALTAFGKTSQTVLWKYKIPDEILAFVRKDTVPCGILETLGMVHDTETPEWASLYDDGGRDLDNFVRQGQLRRDALQLESRLSPGDRENAVRVRMRQEGQAMMQGMRDKQREQQERQDTRMREALQSPKWSSSLTAEYALKWLKHHKHVREEAPSSLRDEAGAILHRMVLDGAFTKEMCRMLDLWKAWADNAGMKRSDYNELRDKTLLFAQASLLVAMIQDAAAAAEKAPTMDLQECTQIWRKVRLG